MTKKECFKVFFNYWLICFAGNPRTLQKSIFTPIAKEPPFQSIRLQGNGGLNYDQDF